MFEGSVVLQVGCETANAVADPKVETNNRAATIADVVCIFMNIT